MKIRIPFALILIALILWACDEPTPYENDDFTYIPFSIIEDTLFNVTSIEPGSDDIEWNTHFRTWVGETQFYKSGFTAEFIFSDTSLDIAGADSIQLLVNHVKTFPENGGDTLASTFGTIGYYETLDQAIDLENSVYGNPLGTGLVNISDVNTPWTYTLPEGLIADGDTLISLGIFPVETDYFSALYGGGSVSRPSLKFFYHEPDTAGLDSATNRQFSADTMAVYFTEKSVAFDRAQFNYISQLKQDSIVVTLDLTDLEVTGDTLQHIISAAILPGINELATSLHKPDSLLKFSMLVEEPVSGNSVSIEYGDGVFNSNQVKTLIQPGIDARSDEINLIVKATNPGYNPGFLAISKDVTKSALFVQSSLAVQP